MIKRNDVEEENQGSIDHRIFTKRVLIVIGIFGVLALLVYTSLQIVPLLVIVFTAWVTAETLDIAVRYLKRRNLPHWLAIVITVLILLMAITLIMVIIIPPLVDEVSDLIGLARDLPAFVENQIASYQGLRASNDLIGRILPALPQDIREVVPADSDIDSLIRNVNTALPVLTDIGAFIGTAIGKIILYLFLTVLLMLEPEIYYDVFVSLLPSRYEERAREIIAMMRKNIETWSGAILLSVGVTSLLYEIALGLILGLPDALAVSVIAGLMTIIPAVGNTIAIIPVILIAAPFGWTKLIAAVVMYATIGTIQDRVVTPAIMRTELNIPVAGLIIFQLLMVALIGPLGFLLAVPMLAILITLVREVYIYDVLGKKPEAEEIEPPDDEADTEKEKPDRKKQAHPTT